jgi:phage terminase large subunit-like protein
MSIEEVKAKCQREVRDGKSSEDIIESLHASGLTITESMKIIMELFKISLGEAKMMVTGHPAWNNVVNAASPLHDDLIRKID